jgi:hypothetical protein
MNDLLAKKDLLEAKIKSTDSMLERIKLNIELSKINEKLAKTDFKTH